MTMPEDAGRSHHNPTGHRGARRAAWLLPLLALPGALWALYTAVIASAALFGESPTAAEQSTTVGALWSGASLWLVTAVLAAAVSRRAAVALVCVGLAAVFALLAIGSPGTAAPLGTARSAGWVAAWLLPTSWALPVVAVLLAVRGARRAGPAGTR